MPEGIAFTVLFMVSLAVIVAVLANWYCKSLGLWIYDPYRREWPRRYTLPRRTFTTFTPFMNKIAYSFTGSIEVVDREEFRAHQMLEIPSGELSKKGIGSYMEQANLVLQTALNRNDFFFMYDLVSETGEYGAHMYRYSQKDGKPTIEVDINCVEASKVVARALKKTVIHGCRWLDVVLIDREYSRSVLEENLARIPNDQIQKILEAEPAAYAIELEAVVVLNEIAKLKRRILDQVHREWPLEVAHKVTDSGVAVTWRLQEPIRHTGYTIFAFRHASPPEPGQGEKLAESRSTGGAFFDFLEPGERYHYLLYTERPRTTGGFFSEAETVTLREGVTRFQIRVPKAPIEVKRELKAQLAYDVDIAELTGKLKPADDRLVAEIKKKVREGASAGRELMAFGQQEEERIDQDNTLGAAQKDIFRKQLRKRIAAAIANLP